MGGDGTHSQVANGILRSQTGVGDVRLGISDAGTGGDFRRVLEYSGDLRSTCRAIVDGRGHPIDVVSVECRSQGCRPDCFILNMASTCLGAEVVKRKQFSVHAGFLNLRYALGAGQAYFDFAPSQLQ